MTCRRELCCAQYKACLALDGENRLKTYPNCQYRVLSFPVHSRITLKKVESFVVMIEKFDGKIVPSMTVGMGYPGESPAPRKTIPFMML